MFSIPVLHSITLIYVITLYALYTLNVISLSSVWSLLKSVPKDLCPLYPHKEWIFSKFICRLYFPFLLQYLHYISSFSFTHITWSSTNCRVYKRHLQFVYSFPTHSSIYFKQCWVDVATLPQPFVDCKWLWHYFSYPHPRFYPHIQVFLTALVNWR